MPKISENQYRIRAIDAANIAELIEIADRAQLSPWTAQNYIDELKDPNSVMLKLVSQDNETAGFVVGRIIPGIENDDAPDAEIYNIAVESHLRGTGHGKLLLDAFVGGCREMLVSRIWLDVRRSNHLAIEFYRRNGFQQIATRKNFYSDPIEDGLTMRCDLKY